jgi:outer membrane receptor protein involved in Fe transport
VDRPNDRVLTRSLHHAVGRRPPRADRKSLSKTGVLDPFVVQSGDSEGYQANFPLAGTRLQTNLKDIAPSIAVVTRQLLDDTGVQVKLQRYLGLDENHGNVSSDESRIAL